MKLRLILVGCLMLASTLLAAPFLHNITLGYTASPSPGISQYTVYELTPTATNVVATTPGTVLSVTLTNVDTSVSHTYTATATSSNGLESAMTANLTIVAPSAPGQIYVISVK